MFIQDAVQDYVVHAELDIVRVNGMPHLLVEVTYPDNCRTEELILLDEAQDLCYSEIPEAIRYAN